MRHGYSERSGQAAMEFLMTYGWMILSALIVLGALAYYGLFSGDMFSPEYAQANPPFYGKGISAENSNGTGEISLELSNNGPDDFTITDVDATDCGSLNGSFEVKSQSSVVLTIPCDESSLVSVGRDGERIKGTFTIKYRKFGSDLEFTSVGTFFTKLRAGVIKVLQVLFSGSTPANEATISGPLSITLATTSSTGLDRYAFVDLDRSLVAWYRMDDTGSANKIIDLSRYSNNGTNGSRAFQNSSGKFGKSFQFDGTSDSYISIPPVSTLNLTTRTISFWERHSTTDTQSNGMVAIGQDALFDYLALFPDTEGITFSWLNGSGDRVIPTFNNIIPPDTWNHLVAVYTITSNIANVTVYVNGVLRASYQQSDGYTTHPIVTIGSSNAFATPFNGSIDEVLVFNRSLSNAEILSLYSANANQYANNFTGLPAGDHTFTAHTVDSSANRVSTAERTVTVL